MAQLQLKFIQGLVSHIENNLDQEIQVPNLAKEMAISPWHFQRLFKSLVGDSLGSYVRGRRLSRAAEMILSTNKSLIDIALEVGFSSHESFTRSFKAQFLITPKEFRQTRPSFVMQEKPVLTEELFEFLSKRIDKEPDIRIFPKTRVAGFSIQIPSPFMNSIHCSTIAEPWMNLLQNSQYVGNLSEAKFFGITQSLSGHFTEEELSYLAASQVGEDTPLIGSYIEYIIPQQKVAQFDITTNVQDDNLKQKIDSIYGYWLLSSGYKRAQGSDFEFFENMKDPMKGIFDAAYVIPIE